MAAAAVQYRKMFDAHLRRAELEGRAVNRIRRARIALVWHIIADYEEG
jgi:hypothetical protein